MKIRFIVRVAGYKSIIMNIIEKIIPFLPEDKYEIYESDYNPKTNKYTDAENKECINVSFFTEYKEHKEVFISHGIADKNWRNKDSVSQFDYLIVSGELWRQKYIKQGISPERIKVLGYPKLSNLPKITKKDIQNDNKIRVLFAPTHSALEEVSAYPRFVKYLKSFPEDMEIIMSEHPANKKDRKPTLELLQETDVVIADSGSLVYEAWALGIPVVFPSWLIHDGILRYFPHSFEDEIYTKKIGYHSWNMEQLIENIREAYLHGMDAKTKVFIDGILEPTTKDCSGKLIADFLLELLAKKETEEKTTD